MKTKYYIELVDNEDGQYVLQSKWFSSKNSAIKWAKTNIDYVDEEKCSLCIMTADFKDNDNYDVIDSERV